jgi:hypothetical protein
MSEGVSLSKEGKFIVTIYIHMVGKGDFINMSYKCYSNFIAEKKYFNSGYEEHSPEQQQYKRRDIFTDIKCVNTF